MNLHGNHLYLISGIECTNDLEKLQILPHRFAAAKKERHQENPTLPNEIGSRFAKTVAFTSKQVEADFVMEFITSFSKSAFAALLVASAPLAASGQQIIDFSDLSLSPESFYNGADEAGQFSSNGAQFNNHFDSEYGTWGGWAYSNITDSATAGWGNQYAAITGSGFGTNEIYAVGYYDTYTPAIPRIDLGNNTALSGIQVTNTAYAYYSMRDGDDFAKKFGGANGDDPDFFRLTITGLDANENQTGSIDFFLADYRFSDNSLNYIVDEWEWVDLSSFGSQTRYLTFDLESSDTSVYGSNTPAYFALGEVAVIPEPSTWALVGGLFAIGALCFRRRR